MTVQRASNPNARMSAQMIQHDWAKVGITANIVSYEWVNASNVQKTASTM